MVAFFCLIRENVIFPNLMNFVGLVADHQDGNRTQISPAFADLERPRSQKDWLSVFGYLSGFKEYSNLQRQVVSVLLVIIEYY